MISHTNFGAGSGDSIINPLCPCHCPALCPGSCVCSGNTEECHCSGEPFMFNAMSTSQPTMVPMGNTLTYDQDFANDLYGI